MKHFDVIVIGAGSAGELISTTLAKAGKSVALVEMHRVGGECAYVSCMPSKAMLRSANVRNLAKRLVELGAASQAIDLGEDKNAFEFAARRRDQIAEYRNDAKSALNAVNAGVTLFRGQGIVTSFNAISVEEETLSWTDLVISTGSTPFVPEVSGIETIDYWTSDQALSVAQAPETMLIIGGGPVACELAQIFSRFGTKTTVVEFGTQLAGKEHPKIAARLAENLRSEGIEVLLSTEVLKVERVNENQCLVHLSNGKLINVDQLVVATGRQPNTKNLGLEELGVELSETGAISIDEKCKVSGQEHVWAAGDVTGIAPFTHTANYQGIVITDNLMGIDRIANYSAIPRAIYTDPPIASVGILPPFDESDGYVSAEFELANVSRTSTDGELGGLLILTADPINSLLVGAFAIGPHADEWMAEATLAIRAKVKLSILADVVHAFPTYGQAFEQPFKELVKLCPNNSD